MTRSRSPKWYKGGNYEELEQGDLLPNCPIVLIPKNLGDFVPFPVGEVLEIPASIGLANLIIVSQTCDLQKPGKTENVLLCAYQNSTNYEFSTQHEVFKGKRPALFMLEECDLSALRLPKQIVDFRSTFTLPIDFVKTYARSLGRRARLNSPYKEDLARAFGSFFSRVARPRALTPPKKVSRS